MVVAAAAVAAAVGVAVGVSHKDRVGLAWRTELAAGIMLHLDRIDMLEVLADSLHAVPAPEIEALRTLGQQVPISLHGVAMGLASSHATPTARIEVMARWVDRLSPESWSEHLAFVRAGGVEIGHMAAPPRTGATVAGAIANIERATQLIGRAPMMENIATLVAPPASTLLEGEWTSAIVNATQSPLLLDLHNLYVNALNFGVDPFDLLATMPLERVASVHLSGGEWISAPSGARRLLDDHRHDPPAAIYALLQVLAARASQPLSVVIERDGDYPAIEVLLAQMERARAAVAAGRAQRAWRQAA